MLASEELSKELSEVVSEEMSEELSEELRVRVCQSEVKPKLRENSLKLSGNFNEQVPYRHCDCVYRQTSCQH